MIWTSFRAQIPVQLITCLAFDAMNTRHLMVKRRHVVLQFCTKNVQGKSHALLVYA